MKRNNKWPFYVVSQGSSLLIAKTYSQAHCSYTNLVIINTKTLDWMVILTASLRVAIGHCDWWKKSLHAVFTPELTLSLFAGASLRAKLRGSDTNPAGENKDWVMLPAPIFYLDFNVFRIWFRKYRPSFCLDYECIEPWNLYPFKP